MRTSKRKTDELYPGVPVIAAQLAPTVEQIHQRAQDMYVARGGTGGMALNDWLRAEQELKHENSQH